MPESSPHDEIRSRQDHWDRRKLKNNNNRETKCMWNREEEDVCRDGRMRAGERQSGKVNI